MAMELESPATRQAAGRPAAVRAPVRAAPRAAPDPTAAWRDLDRLREAGIGRITGGLSPEALALAWFDWGMHLAVAPGKRLQLALHDWSRPADASADPRFADSSWRLTPFEAMATAFLRCEDWWREATHGVPGTVPHHESVVAFASRQLLDMLSPSNLPWTNPQVVARTIGQGGRNLWTGALHWMEDAARAAGLAADEEGRFVVGRDLAATPGKVVMRNELAELIQYTPTTSVVEAEPVLIVPAWIMKYYILDLSAHDSLVRWLVGQGHTVFCLSWRNVDASDRDLGMDDYRRLGVMAALDAVTRIVPGQRVHAAGYCLGGTLLAIAAAAMAGAGDDRLRSLTLFAAQTDFSEPGELALFIDPAQVHMLDSLMWLRGYLTAGQMSWAFQMLRSNDLVWSRMVHEYLMGERPGSNDLMAWNADATRMPYRMHSEYLHQLFLGNDLASNRYRVDGHRVMLQRLRLPVFVVGTETDHVAPWRSVYKLHDLTDAPITFVLCNGGHNAGIVNEPGHPHRHFRMATRTGGVARLSADEWFEATSAQPGSWWTAWERWLVESGTRQRVPPPAMGAEGYPPIDDAPGRYVLER
ncbi:MAG: PHA/PHB synthase family protein [Burkholderiaceae bacterium]